MKAIRYVMVAATLTLGLATVAQAHPFIGVGIVGGPVFPVVRRRCRSMRARRIPAPRRCRPTRRPYITRNRPSVISRRSWGGPMQ